MRLLKQLFVVAAGLGIIASLLMIFAYDLVKVDWITFMEIQPSYGSQEEPRPVPAQSIPVEGVAYSPALGEPTNPIPADETSVARGHQIFQINCQMCHGEDGQGQGTISAFLVKVKPANLTTDVVQSKTDGALFISITNGVFKPENSLFPEVKFSAQMPPMKENLSVRERWDVINFLRTLNAAAQ